MSYPRISPGIIFYYEFLFPKLQMSASGIQEGEKERMAVRACVQTKKREKYLRLLIFLSSSTFATRQSKQWINSPIHLLLGRYHFLFLSLSYQKGANQMAAFPCKCDWKPGLQIKASEDKPQAVWECHWPGNWRALWVSFLAPCFLTEKKIDNLFE